MRASSDALPRQRKVCSRRSRDVNNIQPFACEHLTHIAVPCWNAVPNGQLFGQQWFSIADRSKLRSYQMLDYLRMPVSNLSTPDDPNSQLPQIRHLQ
jgi:hypothetical protein